MHALLVLALLAADPAESNNDQPPDAAEAPAEQEVSLPKPDSHRELDGAISHAVELLEAEEHEKMIRLMVAPDELQVILGQETLDHLVSGFRGKKAEVLLAVLKQVDGKEPQLSKEGNRATFAIDHEQAPVKEIVFEKIDGYWYLRN